MFNPGLLTSNKLDYKTPKELYTFLDDIFKFDFDPCPTNPNFDGLSIEWGKCNFVNPPYGTQIKHWIKKAWDEAQTGKLVVLLIPSRTDTQYWHTYVMRADELWFIQGRLKFNDGEAPAPFPSVLVIFCSKTNSISPQIKSITIPRKQIHRQRRTKEELKLKDVMEEMMKGED